ncbi:hypothetical protein [Mycolicibacterium thermoresistibile]|uniref:Uncharacterized protein n=1 Tax=Mycolicibacterium thermoresistibile (strain ATCC 19527 / DSM 44167 / CIP 105390 / JCM 6362 / NCTC 10409 / 316) TaxID=1078020 RepID=G7CLF0_MYCT3|nr:hypothetical protein [Mycolicibacterium thermoresistibile]EHI11226.1 hypothetical protein KEK_19209 [Mycolicibacterium thermoresistibile ATCC 19527]MCV7188635.1 hypothetical protein [Mycolicibacterium thermoresistibile]
MSFAEPGTGPPNRWMIDLIDIRERKGATIRPRNQPRPGGTQRTHSSSLVS